MTLNIQQGNGAFIVIGGQESCPHGEGRQFVNPTRKLNGSVRLMRSSKVVLENLIRHCKNEQYQFKRLYRLLFNENLFLTAYSNIYAKEGNMTPGTDGTTIDGINLSKIRAAIETLKDCSYQPKPARRVYIPKKNGKRRPLGIPSFQDKFVQEVIRMILESIYEGSFQECSHGFRPKKAAIRPCAR